MKAAAVLLLALLAGCATTPQRPVCAEVEISAIQTPHGIVFLMNEAQMGALVAQMRALEAGACRLRGEEKTI